ncbi:MAG: triose-phosphate isomerase, partial [Candidatus Poribacteria bacterium]|nr:triose-phosphate isomerase [Candidatus Poribacteria bacterium]
MRKPIIAGNWKLNKTISQAVDFVTELQLLVADATDEVEIVVAPVFTVLSTVAAVLKETRIGLSAQDLYWEESGAFTGEVSAGLLRDAGCSYVIIGHSERRQYFGENN